MAENVEQEQVWFPDDQHGYSIAICECEGGAYLGARQMGQPCVCERCKRLTRDQWDFLVDSMTANLRMQYEASQGALSDLLTEHRVTVEAVEALAAVYDRSENWRTWGIPQAIRRALNVPFPPGRRQ